KTPKQQHVYKTLNDALKDQTTKFRNKTQETNARKNY
ncbi:unnamed protein product, partial [Rotaria magnacalcarata]